MKDSPFFLSLENHHLHVISGDFEKKVFKTSSFAFSKIPLDVLRRGEIVQEQMVAKMIQDLLNNSQPKKIKSNFCYFSLPDEFVFTKFVTIPQVKEEELKATIYYKIKDFLPHRPEEMYLDWQLLVDHGEHFEVSVAAVRKEIIDSYLRVCKVLNIFPLGFEPESYSLASLIALNSTDPGLIIYFNNHKIIFCFSENEAVLLTTTFIPPAKPNSGDILAEVNKSAKFWQTSFGQKKKLKNIYLGGNVTDELIIKQAVKKDFGLDIKKLPLPVVIPPGIIPERLNILNPLFGLAFSQREKESSKGKSSSARKITLIPAQVRQERKLFKFKKKVKGILKLAIFFLSCFIAVYSFVFLSIFFQLDRVNASLSGAEKIIFTSSQVELEKKAINFNSKLISLDQALKKRQIISPFLTDFIKQIPAGVVIEQMSLNISGKTIEIQGRAKRRQDVLTLEKALAKFGQVTVPLSSFEQSQDSEFKAVIKLQKIN